MDALREELSQQRDVLDGVVKEKDVAIATLNTHNLYHDFLNHLEEVKGQVSKPSSSHSMLIQQNEQLKSVVSSMRREMEQLSLQRLEQLSLQRPDETTNRQLPTHSCSHGYMKYLERELVSVKSENRRLRAEGRQLQGGGECSRPPHPPQNGERAHSSPHTKHSHLMALSEAITVLQKEKKIVELRAIWLQQALAAVQTSLRAREEEVGLTFL